MTYCNRHDVTIRLLRYASMLPRKDFMRHEVHTVRSAQVTQVAQLVPGHSWDVAEVLRDQPAQWKPNGSRTRLASACSLECLFSCFASGNCFSVVSPSTFEKGWKGTMSVEVWRADVGQVFGARCKKKRNIDDAGICWGAYLLKSGVFGCDPRLHHSTGPES